MITSIHAETHYVSTRMASMRTTRDMTVCSRALAVGVAIRRDELAGSAVEVGRDPVALAARHRAQALVPEHDVDGHPAVAHRMDLQTQQQRSRN
jgi:hypothetical protein